VSGLRDDSSLEHRLLLPALIREPEAVKREPLFRRDYDDLLRTKSAPFHLLCRFSRRRTPLFNYPLPGVRPARSRARIRAIAA
jgi:hypothetical protein